MYRKYRLLLFILEIIGLIILLSALIPLFLNPYDSLVAKLADLATPSQILIQAKDGNFLIALKEWAVPMSMYSLPFLGGLILILALMVTTPGIPWRKRPIYVLFGLLCSLALQAISLIVIGLLAYFNADRWVGRSIATLFVSLGIDLFPVLIWFIISYKYWWQIFSKVDISESPPI